MVATRQNGRKNVYEKRDFPVKRLELRAQESEYLFTYVQHHFRKFTQNLHRFLRPRVTLSGIIGIMSPESPPDYLLFEELFKEV